MESKEQAQALFDLGEELVQAMRNIKYQIESLRVWYMLEGEKILGEPQPSPWEPNKNPFL